jgi:hypothetical protein
MATQELKFIFLRNNYFLKLTNTRTTPRKYLLRVLTCTPRIEIIPVTQKIRRHQVTVAAHYFQNKPCNIESSSRYSHLVFLSLLTDKFASRMTKANDTTAAGPKTTVVIAMITAAHILVLLLTSYLMRVLFLRSGSIRAKA